MRDSGHSWKMSRVDQSGKMVNKELPGNVTDGKKYLEEVMGIVEDEAFNRERKRKLRSLKLQNTNQRLKREPIETDLIVEDSSVWCGTKVRISKSLNIKLKHIAIRFSSS